MSSRKSSDIMDVSEATVKNAMEEFGAQLLIHGHTHRPNIHEVWLDEGIGKRIVLGDWDTLAWCVEITDDGIELKSWSISS
jgi:UDP-2,3-diacylglucosamine hydrolase